jgi:hypothetical protein
MTTNAQHGTARRYATGCTCDPCTDGNTERMNIQRLKREGQEPPVHGASAYRNWGCSCPICRDASNQRTKDRRQANGRGKNHRRNWSDGDLALAIQKKDGRRYTYTALQVAVLLGRSVAAVNQQRSLARARIKSMPGPAAPRE